MTVPAGRCLQLLSPFDPRQELGKRPRVYPLHLLEPTDWFAVEDESGRSAVNIRAAVVNFRRKHPERRFSVRRCSKLGAASVICCRVA